MSDQASDATCDHAIKPAKISDHQTDRVPKSVERTEIPKSDFSTPAEWETLGFDAVTPVTETDEQPLPTQGGTSTVITAFALGY